MDRHLDFDDIVNFIYADKLNEDTEKLARRVNSHIIGCPECRDIYRAVHDLYELGFEGGVAKVSEKIRDRVVVREQRSAAGVNDKQYRSDTEEEYYER